MKNIRCLYLIIFVLQLFLKSLQAGEAYLSRMTEDEQGESVEACRYFSSHSTKDKRDDEWEKIGEIPPSTITFKDDNGNLDLVYGAKYKKLNKEIDNLLEFVRQSSRPLEGDSGDYPYNFLTVVLCVTGHKEGTTKRLYANLFASKNADQLEFSTEVGKIAMFACDRASYLFSAKEPEDIKKRERYLKVQAQKDTYEYITIKGFRDFKHKKVRNDTHTEPLVLTAIKKLSKNAFTALLPAGYEVDYCEVHMISAKDACTDCKSDIYREIPSIKQHFNEENIFVFFHSAELDHNAKDYAVRVPDVSEPKAAYYVGRFFKEKCCEKVGCTCLKLTRDLHGRSSENFDEAPPYYIAINHELLENITFHST